MGLFYIKDSTLNQDTNMPVPKRKTSKRRRDQRHANRGLDVATITHCPNSGAPVMPHTVCLESGYYKGVKVMKTKQDRLEARGKKRDMQKPSQKAEQAEEQVVAEVEQNSEKQAAKKKAKA